MNKKDIILPNKWSEDERLAIAEKIVVAALKTSDALGFDARVQVVGPGHRQLGFKRRSNGFDLPTVLTEAQGLRTAITETLEKLGVK